MIEYGSQESKFVHLPKIGEEAIFDIATARKVEGGRFNFLEKAKQETAEGEIVTVEKDLGYHYEYTMTNGKVLTISSWCPFYAFRDAGVNDNMKIKVSHPEKGVWKIQKIRKEDEAPFR